MTSGKSRAPGRLILAACVMIVSAVLTDVGARPAPE